MKEERGVAEAVSCSRSEQASDGREAHRGSVSGSEHTRASWAVQARRRRLLLLPLCSRCAACGSHVWFGISVFPLPIAKW